MAEFDKLEISIEADASKAQTAIDNLSKSLGSLDNSLNLKNLDSFLSALKDIGNTSGLSGLGNIFKNIDFSGALSSIKEITNELNTANTKAQNLANTLKNLRVGDNVDTSKLKDQPEGINVSVSEKLNDGDAFKEVGIEAKETGVAIQQSGEQAKISLGELRNNIEVLTESLEKMGESAQKTIGAASKAENVKPVKSPSVEVSNDNPERTLTKWQAVSQTLVSVYSMSKEVNGLLSRVGSFLNRMGDSGLKVSKMMLVPLKAVVNEYKEKLDKIKGFFEKFRKEAQVSLQKLSAFWKRTMKTFTFMLVRKAITAIIGEIKEATESLALFSKEMGTAFNENISNAMADFKWIGKAIVGAFEPIINYVVPVLNVLSAALVKVITLLGHFFAAMTGQGYYMVAKKKVDDYAKSLKKAQKQTQLSIRGFDELNNLTTPKSSDSDKENNPASDWEMKPVSDKMKKFADMIKDLAKKLWEPIAKAWDRTKEYVISGFKYMVGELGKLAKSIGRDFLKAWQEEQTVHIFENIFNMVGDIERVVGNLAKNFRKAWDTVVDGETRGYWIFHGILKIVDTLTTHLRNVTEYMVEWSDSITFDALLDSFIRLLGALDKVADFIGGVFEDVMKNVVLKYVKWLIEEGTPHLLNTISEIINAVDWESVRRGLFIIEKAFESLLENVHTGVTNAIGLVGKAFAEWVNSDKYIKFMQALANIMNQITAERVEKILGGIGLAILRIAESLADFVSSDQFQKFVESIGEWIDKHSAEDIANMAKGIIEFAAACKVLGGVAGKLTGVIDALYKIKLIGTGKNILKGLGNVNKAASMAKGAKAIKPVTLPGFNKAGGVEVMEKSVPSLSAKFAKLGEAASKAGTSITNAFSKAGSSISSVFTSINWGTVFTGDIGANMAAGGATAGATFAAGLIASIAAAIGGYNFGKLIGDKFIDKGETGIYKDFKLFDFKNLFSGDVKADLQASFDAVISMFTDFENNPAIATITNVFGALSMPLVTLGVHLSNLVKDGKFDVIGEKLAQLKEDVTGAFSLMGQDIQSALAPVTERVSAIFQGLGIIIKAIWMTIVGWFNTNVVQPIIGFFQKLVEGIKSIWSSVTTWFYGNVIQPLVNFFRQLWTDVISFFTQLWAGIQAIWITVSTWFYGTVIQPIINFFRQLWTDVSNFFTQLWTGIKSVWSVAANWFMGTVIQPIKNAFNSAVAFIKNIFTSLWSSIKNGVRACFNSVIGVIERAVNGIIGGVNKFFEMFNGAVSLAAKVTGDSAVSVNLIPKVSLPRFATGGFPPEDGLFMANHSELIGEFSNGQTAVANNEQIIEGIKAGVMDAMMQVLPSFAQAVGGETNITIEGDMGKLFKAMVKENGSMNKRTFGGSPLYA